MRLIKDNLPLPPKEGRPTLASHDEFVKLAVGQTLVIEPSDYDGTVNAMRTNCYHWARKLHWQVHVRSMLDGIYVKRVK